MTYEITEADIIEMNKFLDTVVNEDTEHTHKHLMKEYSKDGSPKFSHYMVDKEDYLTKVTPKQFAKSSLPDKTSDKTKEDHLAYLRAKIPQFNRKVEHNSWVKKHNPSYDEELKKLTEGIDESYHEVHMQKDGKGVYKPTGTIESNKDYADKYYAQRSRESGHKFKLVPISDDKASDLYHKKMNPNESVTESFKVEELSYSKTSPITSSLAEAIASVIELK